MGINKLLSSSFGVYPTHLFIKDKFFNNTYIVDLLHKSSLSIEASLIQINELVLSQEV